MITLKSIHETLLILIIVSFGFFGSLSHLFTLLLLLLYLFCFSTKNTRNVSTENSILLYCLLVSPFFLFFFRSLISNDLPTIMQSISPMLPIPILGTIILITAKSNFKISKEKISNYAELAILFIIFVCLLALNMPKELIPKEIEIWSNSRLNLLTGNPIPFSLVVFCISVLCISGWINFSTFKKIKAAIIFFLGIYIAIVLTETRGTMLAFFVTIPILLWHIQIPNILNIAITAIAILILIAGVFAQFLGWVDIDLLQRLISAISTVTSNSALDESMSMRLEMWKASIKTIMELPYTGYGISERFTSIKPNLPADFSSNFSHPHNDIFAATIVAGMISGFLSITALLSPFWAWFFSNKRDRAGLFLGLTFSIAIFSTASLNTVFFNDVTSAWLAFSTFLVWRISMEHF